MNTYQVIWKMKDGRILKDNHLIGTRQEVETYAGIELTQMETEGVESYEIKQVKL